MSKQIKHTRVSKLGKQFEAGENKTINLDFIKTGMVQLVEATQNRDEVRVSTSLFSALEFVATKTKQKIENVLIKDVKGFFQSRFTNFVVSSSFDKNDKTKMIFNFEKEEIVYQNLLETMEAKVDGDESKKYEVMQSEILKLFNYYKNTGNEKAETAELLHNMLQLAITKQLSEKDSKLFLATLFNFINKR